MRQRNIRRIYTLSVHCPGTVSSQRETAQIGFVGRLWHNSARLREKGEGSDMPGKRKAIWGWMFFDWANQPFHTLILTFTFAPYFVSKVSADPAQGQAAWGYAISIGSIVIALMAPVLGAVADARGPRRPWILIFSALYVVGAAGLWGATPGLADLTPILIFLVVALIGAELDFAGMFEAQKGTGVFTNSLLPELGTKGRSRPHLRLGLGDGIFRLGLGDGILGRARKPGHRARPDGADPGIGKNPYRSRTYLRPRPGRMARAPAPPARCRRSGTSSS